MSQPKSNPSDAVDSAEEDRIAGLVKDYMNQWEAGRRPNRADLLASHPEIAKAMTPYLDGLDAIYDAGLTKRILSFDEEIATPDANGAWPQPLGDFRIVREIGRGGMGAVYEATQLSLGRKVALKILPLAAALDDRNLRRFKTEAQAAAMLHHSNIVPVYAVGCERGVHFYAMQLIEGQSLADIIRQMRDQSQRNPAVLDFALSSRNGTASTADHQTKDYHANGQNGQNGQSPSSKKISQASTTMSKPDGFAAELTTMHDAGRRDFFRTVARLIRDAALALEYAHKSGVVHRDIKPGNLLVDRTGNLWITDFGLAQFHEEIGPTRTGDLLGTLQYMSPEQASGQRVVLDARTDVYSLGATLYEMLAIRPMFDGQNRQAVLRQISNEEPKLLRSVDRAIPPELEIIVLKATAKAPTDRYATAQAFADDLESFLHDRPILAKRPTLIDRSRKWARRHPGLVGSAMAMLAIIAVGLAIHTSILSVEQAKTKSALVQEKERAEEAEKGFRQAREAVDLLVQVAEEELRHQPPLANLRRRLLETALTFYQDLLEEDSPTAKTATASLTAAQSRVRKILSDLANLQGFHRFSLLRDSAVQQELSLTDEQQKAVAELAGERFQLMRQMWHRPPPNSQARSKAQSPTGPAGTHPSPPSREETRQKLRKLEEQLTSLLTPVQSDRLDQVILRLEGPHAFSEAHVVDNLKLTKMQRDWMTKVENDSIGMLFADLRAGHSVDANRVREIAQASTDRCLKVLKKEQRDAWSKLIGPPLTHEPKLLLPPNAGGWSWAPSGPPPR